MFSDFNPIEHLLDELEHQQPKPSCPSMPDLTKLLWLNGQITTAIQNVVESLAIRVEVIITPRKGLNVECEWAKNKYGCYGLASTNVCSNLLYIF